MQSIDEMKSKSGKASSSFRVQAKALQKLCYSGVLKGSPSLAPVKDCELVQLPISTKRIEVLGMSQPIGQVA